LNGELREKAMSLTVQDLQQVQAEHPDWKMELVNGEIILMSPSGYESDEVATRMSAKLFNWVDQQRLGRVTGSSAGFVLPNSDTRAPDVSFVLAERLRRSPRSFAELAPDLMVEVKSPTDSLKTLETKILSFLSLGTRVGILLNPDDRTVKIYRSGQASELLQDGEMLTVPDLLPGWEVAVSDLWSPIFEENLDE
jgi:Uma2 family endonuclease